MAKTNADADSLSRQYTDTEMEESVFPDTLKAISYASLASAEELTLIDSISVSGPSTIPVDDVIPDDLLRGTALSSHDWKCAHQNDQEIPHVMERVDDRYVRQWKSLVVHDGVLLRNTTHDRHDSFQMVIPQSLRKLVFRAYHDDLGHQWRDRTLSIMKGRVYWPGMNKNIQEYIKRCGRCIRRKQAPTRAAELVNITSTIPMGVVCIDYLSLKVSKGGFENILVVTDHFSRYAQAIPTRNQTAKTTARVLFDHFFVRYGFPSVLHSDKGANFESKLIKNLCRITGIKKLRTTPYHPMGNGMVERFNKTLLNMLGTLADDNKSDWKSHVSTLTHAYNAAVHDSTCFSPYYLMFGRHPRLAVDAFLGLPSQQPHSSSHADYANKTEGQVCLMRMGIAARESRKAASRYKKYYDEKVRYTALQPGDRVLVRNVGLKGKHKLADTWEETPYIVKRQPMRDIPVYEVYQETAKSSKCRTLHRNMLLPFIALPDTDDVGDLQRFTGVEGRDTSEHLHESSSDSSNEVVSDVHTVSMETGPRVQRYITPARRREAARQSRGRFGEHRRTESPERIILRQSRRQREPPQRYGTATVIPQYAFSVPPTDVIYL